ncbi:LysR family transcriptional regulator [Pantoea stewartii]|uniref:LysR family transcriptional regulator n=1 Tax=Pantoea stewartii TaxID=66269 RepID=UPI0021D50105|nr:LysR family transcriptional regulator [Pantoea stewartii]MCU7369316.1 LysR family transcriptional regulator [Pantoea stewartii]
MRINIPFKALKAFEASARHLNFTKAAQELYVSQAAVSHQIRLLEENLGVSLFKRLPRGLEMTNESKLLLPDVVEAFKILEKAYGQFEKGMLKETISVACVGTFAMGWLLPRLEVFNELHPNIDINLRTNNNVVNIVAEGLDVAIRYGDGNWPSTQNVLILNAPLTILCRPDTAERLKKPSDIRNEQLLRSYRQDEWMNWFKNAEVDPFHINGPVFDSSRLIVDAALMNGSLALVPASMFSAEVEQGLLVQPFNITSANEGYWFTFQNKRANNNAIDLFRNWIVEAGRKK